MQKPKILVILGPTATGKSDLAVFLAKKWNGEVISADSRQVYKGLNIGTGKITKKEMLGIPHYLLDVSTPIKVFSVSLWKEKTIKTIEQILKKGKLPIICGGTGFYISSVVNCVSLPEVPPNYRLRKNLEKKSSDELFNILKKLDPKRAENIDSKNKVRIIRAIEIARALGKVPKIQKEESPYNFIQIGLDLEDNKLKERIKIRLKKRMSMGMVAEAKRLHKEGLSYKRMRELGLEYRFLADFLEKKHPLKTSSGITRMKEKMLSGLEKEIWQYVKRQRTWFKRDKNIKWLSPMNYKGVEKFVSKNL